MVCKIMYVFEKATASILYGMIDDFMQYNTSKELKFAIPKIVRYDILSKR